MAKITVLLAFMIVVPFVFLAAAIAAPHKENANWQRIPACASAQQRVWALFSRKLLRGLTTAEDEGEAFTFVSAFSCYTSAPCQPKATFPGFKA
jgi:hypothetical protein